MGTTNPSTKAAEDEVFDAAIQTFMLTTPDEGGVTLFEKGEHLAKTKGGNPFEVPAMPAIADRPMAWFRDLSSRRTVGMALNPITWEAMDAYFRLTGVSPLPWEIRIFSAIENAFMASRNKPKD